MIPGFSGHLISESYLERIIANGADASSSGAGAQHLQRRLIEWRRNCRWLGPASSLRAMLETGAEPLIAALGLIRGGDVEPLQDAIGATLFADPTGGEAVALLVVRWGSRLDPFWRLGVVQAIKRRASWCLLFNGTSARLLDATRLYSRRFAHFDLDVVLDDERALTAFIRTCGHVLDLRALVDASERHAADVCDSLRRGVLEASAELIDALLTRRTSQPLAGAFEQALTVVYRILFLLFAETRRLVPLWHPVYRDSYSMESLTALAERPREANGIWDALRAISRLAHSGCRVGDLRVTAFNGRLFAPSTAPLAERRNLDDRSAQRAVLSLTTRGAPDRQGRERISYRDLGVEQLGGVYETLLDYEPHIETTQANRRVTLRSGSGQRKATGSFYTPQPIAQYLVHRTLAPLVQGATPDRILSLKVLDPAMGSGAFLVAACSYLAQAYEAALIREGTTQATDFGPSEQATIRRTVAERCLFGVDVSPMAVQLAHLSLWLTTLATDRPLSFLDHHLLTGDSLLGAWLADLRQVPAGRPRKKPGKSPGPTGSLPLFEDDAFDEVIRLALPVRFSLAMAPNDTAGQIREKERALALLSRPDTPLSKWKRVADLWCARWFPSPSGEAPPPSAFGALSDSILGRRGALADRIAEHYLNTANEIAARHRFFHWELEFPEVFFDRNGERLAEPGFDAVIGNPPWDVIRADAGPPDRRAAARIEARAVLRFTRDSGAYRAQSNGHANRYQLFTERAVRLARRGGRIGLVLPSGLATDHGSQALRRLLFSGCDVDAVVGFENRRRVFPVHSSVRFLLLSATAGRTTRDIRCRFGERDPAVLDMANATEPGAPRAPGNDDAWFPVRLTPELLERLSGDALAIPDLRTPIDLAILERAVSLFPPLGSKQGWGATFGRELNATDDRKYFDPAKRGLVIVEGKALEPFRVNLQASSHSISVRDLARVLPHYDARPRLAYRDVASPTNRLTLIAALLPAECISTHTVFCLKTPLRRRAQQYLCGLFNSLLVNYFVRLRVTTHVTTAIVERLPIPGPDQAPEAFDAIAASACLLARRPDAGVLARLNARVAHTYHLSRDEFEHVLGTFPLISRNERAAALAEFSLL